MASKKVKMREHVPTLTLLNLIYEELNRLHQLLLFPGIVFSFVINVCPSLKLIYLTGVDHPGDLGA